MKVDLTAVLEKMSKLQQIVTELESENKRLKLQATRPGPLVTISSHSIRDLPNDGSKPLLSKRGKHTYYTYISTQCHEHTHIHIHTHTH